MAMEAEALITGSGSLGEFLLTEAEDIEGKQQPFLPAGHRGIHRQTARTAGFTGWEEN